MLTSCQSYESVVRRATGDAPSGELPMGGARGTRAEREGFSEVLVDQRHRIGGMNASIPGKSGQHRVCFGQRVPAEPKSSPLGPRRDHGMLEMRGHKERQRDTRVDRSDRHRRQRRPESMRANIISSVTTVSARATKRPSASRSSRAVRPPGTMCNPPPYAEISTLVPGVSPNASRSCLGRTTRPPESMTTSMGPRYQ